MKKDEYIAMYGPAAYKKMQKQSIVWAENNREHLRIYRRKWDKNNAKKCIEHVLVNKRAHMKGGKYFKKTLIYNRNGLRGERNKIRHKHGKQWHSYKVIIAPNSQIHHEWVVNTADYRGVALVEQETHQHGIIDVIKILEGEITLFTEKEIRGET